MFRGVFVNRIGGLSGDGDDAVQSRIGDKIAQGKMVMPTSPVIGRPVHRRNPFEQPGFHGAQTNAVHPIAVQIMHHQHRRGIVIDVVHGFINFGSGEQAV